jgi:DNA-binding Xre family transcriptional regulator
MAKSYGELKLKNLMKQKKVSFKELGVAFETTDKNLYQRIKQPQNFTIDECVIIANALGCPVKEIIKCVVKL